MEKNLFPQSSLFALWMKKTFLPHYSPCRWQKCVCWWAFQAETLSMGIEFHHSPRVVPLWIFPALQIYTSLLIARDTCNPHTLGTLSVGSQQFSWTWSWSKQSYRRVLHNEVTSSHRPAALPAAAQTTGTKNKWHNSCTSLQNYSDLAVSPLICVQWHKWRAGKNARQGWIKLRKHRNFRMQVCNSHQTTILFLGVYLELHTRKEF